jgi:hypothetical protein
VKGDNVFASHIIFYRISNCSNMTADTVLSAS